MSSKVDKDRYYPNCYVGREDLIRPTEVFKRKIQDEARKLLVILEKQLAKKNSMRDYTIYTGVTGIALLYWHLSKLMDNPEYQKKALALVEPTITHLKFKRFSFLGGDAGPLALLAVIYHESGNHAKRNQMIQKLISLGDEVCDQRDPLTSNELLFGRAGYLYALLFVNSNTFTSDDSEKLIDSNLIQKVVNVIIQEGMRSKQNHLYYEWHEKCYIGAGHGVLGIIHTLLMTPESLNTESLRMIKNTLDWLLTLKFESGNIPSSLESRNNDRLIHWCHGASGAVWTWFLAFNIFKDELYLTAAKDCAAVIWERGILRKGYSICHGVSSSSYGLMAAYVYTKEPKYLEQAFLFCHWCFSYGTKSDYPPDRPLSLFEGIAGAIYMLADFGWNSNPKFPAFIL